MRKVECKFDVDDKVKTNFGCDGIISMIGVDGEGIQYYVKTAQGSDWYKEKLLTLGHK